MGILQIIVLLLLTNLVYCTPVIVEQIKNTDVLFEKIGTVIEYQDTIHIYTKMQLTTNEEMNEFLISITNQVDNTCLTLLQYTETRTCDTFKKEINLWVDSITKSTTGINHYFSRRKRGAINIIGSVSKMLFGTMDENDADKIYSGLENLKNNGEKVMELLDHQTAIIASNFEFMKDVTGNLTARTIELEDRLGSVEKLVKKKFEGIQNEMKHIWAEIELHKLIIYVLAELERVQGFILEQGEIINALQQHKIHPSVIDSQLLVEVLQNMTNNDANMHLYSAEVVNQLANIDLAFWEKQIGIRVSINVLKNEEFQLYKIYPLPIADNNGQITIVQTDWDYIANNSAKQYIYYTTKDYAYACRKIKIANNELIEVCRQLHPKLLLTNSEDCIVKIFRNFGETGENKQCQRKVIKNVENHVIPLQTENSWLFIFFKKQELTSFCNSHTIKQVIVGTGIVKFIQKCSNVLGSLEIPYFDRKIKRVGNMTRYIFNKIPTITHNFTGSEEQWTLDSNITSHVKPLGPDELRYEFDKRSFGIKKLQDEINKEKNRQQNYNYLKTNTLTNTIILSIIVIIIIIFIIIKIIRCCQPSKNYRPEETYEQPIEIKNKNSRQIEISRPIELSSPVKITGFNCESPTITPIKTKTQIAKIRSKRQNIVKSDSSISPVMLSFR